jgi:hypothetical protein
MKNEVKNKNLITLNRRNYVFLKGGSLWLQRLGAGVSKGLLFFYYEFL